MPSTIAERLREAREARGISAKELDRRAGKTPGHAALIEARPGSDLWVSTVVAYCLALDLHIEWLIQGTGRQWVRRRKRELGAAA